MPESKIIMTYDYSPEIGCPYDGDLCEHKQARLKKWKDAVRYHAENAVDNVIYTSADMFDGCPLDVAQRCQRYKRYEYIVNNMKQRGE